MTERVDELLDVLARRNARGEELDLAGLLTEAGDEAERFADLAARFLEAAPRSDPSEADLAYVAALTEPPLLRLRLRRKLKVAAVAKQLAIELKVKDLTRLQSYYQRLEGGVLDPDRVDARVWAALSSVFEAPVRALAAGPPLQPATEAVYHRMQDEPVPVDALVASASPLPGDPAPSERDELDRLFLGAD